EMLVKKLIKETIPRGIEFSDEEIKTYYRENREEFKEPETVHARHIVAKDEATAQDILRRLNEGEAFEDLARSLSISPDGIDGGDLGFFPKGEMPEEFDVVFNLKKGEISPIVQTPYGRHLFKLEERRPSRLVPLEEAEPAIRKHLGKLRHEKLFAIWIEGLRERAKITVNENILFQPIGTNSESQKNQTG
ncbi:MAG TPA: peptidylprolyl isomerase, partial [Nitrospiria bacterium]|nr:peptidylprolyl isomerase [Nitrospiria bacterium]